jgi:glycosyltransferase involved in cell wall biosynthesis
MLSVVVITRNEGQNLSRCLQSVSFASEIIVVDSGSTDNTLQIARQFTPHVYEMDWRGFGIQKQRALEKATCPWVLNLDADEFIDEPLRVELLQAIEADVADAFQVPIRLQFYGKSLRYASSPAHHVRLYKRVGAAYSTAIVHEQILLPTTARIGQLKHAMMHHCYQDVSHMIQKLDKYSSYSASMRLKSKRTSSLTKACLGAWWMFVRSYFLQRGILDGKLGLLFSIYQAQGSFYRAVKQCYPDRNMTFPEVHVNE